VIRGLKVLGLTGGIGTGKSTVARMFAERGVPVVDADALAREVVAPGLPAHADIAVDWPEVLGPDGALDRKRLGAIVFADPAARLRLEAITHPRIQALAAERLAAHAEAGHRLALYEASLLVESGRWREFDGLIVVTAAEATQIARVRARDGLSQAGAEARVRAQLPAAEKVRLASYLVDNDGGLDATRAAVEDLLRRLRSDETTG
jgi:dephospho-CoA kinase